MNQGKRQFSYRLVSWLNLAAICHTLYSARSDFRLLTSSMVCFEIMLGIINRTDNSFTYFEESAAEMTATVWWCICCFLLWCSTEPSDFNKEGQGWIRTSLTVTYCKLQLHLQSLSSNNNEHKVKVHNIWLYKSSADADNLFSGQSRSTNMVPFWVRCDFSLSMWPPPRVTTV